MFERICIIALATLVFYFKTLQYKYVSDDIPISRTKNEFKNRWHKLYRQILGEIRVTPQQDHAMTMVIHALVCIFLYLGFGANDMSFLAALLMVFNPMTNQGSVWISGRGYTLPALLILISLTVPFLAPFALYGCSWFTIGFLSPLALLGSSKPYLVALMPLMWLLHRKRFVGAVNRKLNSESYTEDKVFHWKKLILATKTVGFYLVFCLVPIRVTFYHNFLQSCSGNSIMKAKAYTLCRYFWAGAVAIALTIYLTIFHWGSISQGMVWFMIAIAPFSNIRRNNQEIADRFAYIACIGAMVFLSSILVHYPVIAAAFVGMYATKMWFSMEMYKDDYWIVEYAVMEDPHAWYAWHIRGMKRWDTGSFKEALIMWVMAKMISPKEFKVLYNLALALRVLRNVKESDEYIKMAEDNIVAGQEQQARDVINALRSGKAPLLV